MIVTIQPTDIRGSVNAPTSKSSMQRACAAALLSHGSTRILHPGRSNDDLAAIDTIGKLGADVQHNDDGSLTVKSSGVAPVFDTINCGESGLGIRMFTPIAALSKESLTITGSGSLLTRPMNFFDEIFPLLDVDIQSQFGRPPLHIRGPLVPATITVDGSLSSQFLTGLLMAYGAAGASDVSIKVRDLKSRPYIDLTLQVMRHFGVNVVNNDYESFYFPAGNDLFTPATYTVEGDWSGGAFLLVAGAIAGDVIVKGLDINSTQADKVIMQALMSSGAKLSIKDNNISIGPAALRSFHFDATDCPDLFPPLVALAAYCEGTTVIEGVGRLAHKESNRSLTLQEEFGKMGVRIQLEENKMMIEGKGPVNGSRVFSHHDHRIAMACGVAALKAGGEVCIDDAEAINKSYPDFFEDLMLLGTRINIQQTKEATKTDY